jgi:tripartite-type tricarboxylate transporter receptor subunit TctC
MALAASVAAQAQQFPTKRVAFVSGVTPGSASDTMARILAEKLQQKWGQTVIVENRLGAGGLVGAKYVAQSEPDGHLIMMYASAYTVSPLLQPDVMKTSELQPVATVATIPTVLVAQPEKYKTIKDFVGAAKANPGKLVCADAGIGSATHMAFERFRFAAGIPEVINVHTKGVGEALTEVVSGRADCYFALVFQAKKIVDSGKLVALGTSSPKRSALMPNIPTLEEQGFHNASYNFWVGALVPAKTPHDIVVKLNGEVNRIMRLPDAKAKLEEAGTELNPITPEQFTAFVHAEIAKYAKLVKAAHVSID